MNSVTFHAQPVYPKDNFGYIVVPITDEIYSESTRQSEQLGSLKNSIRHGEGNLAGYIGQEAVRCAIEGMSVEETYNYDLKCGETRIEVKTKDRTVRPKPYYECSVAASNPTQNTDYYMFVSLLRQGNQYAAAYILGYIAPLVYIRNAQILHKGDLDPANNFTVRADCYNLKISNLNQIQ
jgi:hypothetical protein